MKTKWTVEKLQKFEEDLKKLFLEGKIRAPLHLSGGNEEELISIFRDIKPKDYVFSTHRNHYHYLLKGGHENSLFAEIIGDESGICKGNSRSMNTIDPSIRFYSSAVVAGNCAMAVGVALALKKVSSKNKVWCFVGDGAEDSGHFMEAVRFGLSRALPLTFVVEDNDFSTDSTKVDRWHNYQGVRANNVMRYEYQRRYPHVGVGKHVTF